MVPTNFKLGKASSATAHIDAANSDLRQITVERIDRNPENPRILFRQGELEQLLESIRLYGIQVPISVYRENNRFILIDGERRWKCALKLNMKTIPALVQDKPTPITNLLLMFNIHALREEWDLLTIALKLPRVISLLTTELGTAPTEIEISRQTGLSRSVIRRSKLLINLPEKYKDQILAELNKPKSQQKLTEDLFIEMERALKTVETYMPGVIKNKDRVRDILISKYKKGLIPNIVYLRKIPKIARAASVEGDEDKARSVLERLFQSNEYSIEEAFEDSVSEAYLERDLVTLATRIDLLLNRMEALAPAQIDEEIRETLRRLVQHAQKILEGTK
jgi:ParB family transcriptional regulator, chromosome partitioning protein